MICNIIANLIASFPFNIQTQNFPQMIEGLSGTFLLHCTNLQEKSIQNWNKDPTLKKVFFKKPMVK